jgi:hypothetical protein
MSEISDLVTADAVQVVTSAGAKLSVEAFEVIRDTEHLAWSIDNYVYSWTFFAVVLRRVKAVRSALARHGADPDFAADAFEQYTRWTASQHKGSAPYDTESTYSNPYKGERRLATRPKIIDLAIEFAQRDDSEITGTTIFEALLADHEDVCPFISNADHSDPRLKTPFNTFAHVLGQFEPSLFIRLSELRDDLGLPHYQSSLERPQDTAAPGVRAAVMAFLVDHPEYQKNCFLIMPFAQTRTHDEIASTLKAALKSLGFNLVRADEHVYSEDLLTNIQAYIHGCAFGVAVFERILTNDFNPNVSLEVGYCLGLRKPVCLLKERTLPRLPSDLVGRLYVEFDGQDVGGSVTDAVGRWVRDRGLSGARRSSRSLS